MAALKTPQGKKIIVDINNDVRLYWAPVGSAGIDIYAHNAQSGVEYYYSYTWSVLQSAGYLLLTPDEARERLVQLAGLSEDGRLKSDEIKLAKQYFPGIFDTIPG